MMFENFVDWNILATYAGAVLMTALVTQCVKNAPKIKAIPTQLVSYVVALIVLLASTYFTAGLTVESAALILFNALIVSVAANGTYEGAVKIIGEP